MLLNDGGIVDVLAENVSQALQTLDFALHVRSVLLFYRDGARVLNFLLENFELGYALLSTKKNHS